MRQFEIDDGAFVDALRSLRPEGPALSIEQLSFQAGVKVGRRQANVWRGIAGVVVIASVFAFGLRPKPATVTTERVVVVHEQPSPEVSEPVVVSSASYLRLRDAVIADGWDALPPPTGGGGSPPRVIGVRSFD